MLTFSTLISSVLVATLLIALADSKATGEVNKQPELTPKTSFYLSKPLERGNFDEAFRICESHGMKPVSILTADKDIEVRRYLASSEIDSVWTSGTDLDTGRHNYFWSAIQKKFEYTNWLLAAPHDNPACRCVAFTYGATGNCPGSSCGGWTVDPCSNRHRVLCEMVFGCDNTKKNDHGEQKFLE